RLSVLCFFLHVPAPTAFYTLSLHDALPICFSVCLHQKMFWFLPSHWSRRYRVVRCMWICQSSCDIHSWPAGWHPRSGSRSPVARSEEHTSELQSRENLVCRLLLEKKHITSI